mgnify:CR=1 FL=1
MFCETSEICDAVPCPQSTGLFTQMKQKGIQLSNATVENPTIGILIDSNYWTQNLNWTLSETTSDELETYVE